MNGSPLVQAIAELLEGRGLDLAAWGLAFARVSPVVAIVPAFGLRALSVPIRAATALLLAVVILPAVRLPPAIGLAVAPLLLLELLRGVSIAVAAAIPLWAATMTGGVIDALRGAQETVEMPTVEGKASPMGALFALLAAVIFLGTGGPARLVGLLISPPVETGNAVARAALTLASGIGVATALAAPLLAASLILEITGALIARAASPAQLQTLLAPLRSLALLVLSALFLERLAALLAVLQAS